MKTEKIKNHFINLIFITVTSCLLYAISSGIRANYGIMINGISENSGLSYSSVSFVFAIAQLIYGITQPLFGIVALKKSSLFVLIVGAVLMIAGIFVIPFCHSMWSLLICIGILLATGTGAISFGIIMGAATPLMTEKEAAAISGIVTAGSGIGSTILSPTIQKLISGSGLQAATNVLCIPIILLIPMSYIVFSNKKKNCFC